MARSNGRGRTAGRPSARHAATRTATAAAARPTSGDGDGEGALTPRVRPGADPFKKRAPSEAEKATKAQVHRMDKGVRCDTDQRGYASPGGLSPQELVLDASEGFIPLWAPDSTLRWRFRESSMNFFANPAAAKAAIRKLVGDALLAWGDAAPVKFTEDTDTWDFEIVMKQSDDCDINGCVLAAAFFPDAGRHQLELYPQMFGQSHEEQVETLIHEIGHVFGLRHFFAQLKETQWASEIFGTHSPFTIMNYGEMSKLTSADKSDLKRLYNLAWAGQLTHINNTPIRFVKPYHTVGELSHSAAAVAELPAALSSPLGARLVTLLPANSR